MVVCGCNMTKGEKVQRVWILSPFCPTAGHIIEAEQKKLATKTEMKWKSTTCSHTPTPGDNFP